MWNWAKANKTLAAVIVLLLITAFASVTVGLSARNAAARYFDLAKGWAKAYHRDTKASREEYEMRIKALSTERDAYKKKWETARGKMDAPWKAPRGAKELQARFNKRGYKSTLK